MFRNITKKVTLHMSKISMILQTLALTKKSSGVTQSTIQFGVKKHEKAPWLFDIVMTGHPFKATKEGSESWLE